MSAQIVYYNLYSLRNNILREAMSVVKQTMRGDYFCTLRLGFKIYFTLHFKNSTYNAGIIILIVINIPTPISFISIW